MKPATAEEPPGGAERRRVDSCIGESFLSAKHFRFIEQRVQNEWCSTIVLVVGEAQTFAYF
jgi:hypothetical protein